MSEIVCISHKYPPTIGGMENHSYQLINGLKKHFTVHTIIYTEHDGNKLKWFLGLKARIKTLLQNHPNIKLIHLNDGLMGAACRWLIDETDIPVVVSYHGLDLTFPLGIYQNKIIKKMNSFYGAIAQSEATKKECIARGFDPKRTWIAPCGVDHDIADIPRNPAILQELSEKVDRNLTDKKILISMGRPVKRKGFSWFIENVLPKLDDDVILMLIGPFATTPTVFERFLSLLPQGIRHKIHLFLGHPSDQGKLRQLLTSDRKVVHTGPLPFKKLMQAISEADIFVMPNIDVEGDLEGFGLVSTEASLRGTYVVASSIEGITQAVQHNKNGTHVESQNTEQWINTINALLSDPIKLQQLSEEGAEFTKANYSWGKMVGEYVEIFEEVIAEHN